MEPVMKIRNDFLINTESYKHYVEKISSGRRKDIIHNVGVEHASIVLGNIFSSSEKIVRVFSGKMSNEVTSNKYYLQHLKNYIYQTNGHIKILLNDSAEPDEESEAISFIKNLPDEIRNRVEIRYSTESVYLGDDKSKKIHFATGDKSIFRIETDPSNHKAYASFNNSEVTADLIRVFDDLFHTSHAIS
jgi:hypothetical protein